MPLTPPAEGSPLSRFAIDNMRDLAPCPGNFFMRYVDPA
jgi:hypothetical protein